MKTDRRTFLKSMGAAGACAVLPFNPSKIEARAKL
jgi:hypothetical protein